MTDDTRRTARTGILASTLLLAGATLLGGCVVASPHHAAVVVRPPAAVSVHLVRPGWDYVQVGGAWYYGPRGARHFRHDYYVWRGGAWIYVH